MPEHPLSDRNGTGPFAGDFYYDRQTEEPYMFFDGVWREIKDPQVRESLIALCHILNAYSPPDWEASG